VFHTIEFRRDRTVDLEVSPRRPLERLNVRRGQRFSDQVKPYVFDTPGGPVEVADLFFSDGTATRTVPFEHFSFVN
jgi:hypothetical protein